LKKYRKALVVVAGVCAVIGKIAADGEISPLEIGELLGSIAVALGVYQVKNEQ
jgi:hypothetical protein